MNFKEMILYPNFFVDWFNNVFRPKNMRTFPYFLHKENFIYIAQHIKMLTGKSAEEITLEEFIGHFCIIYNETGGQFSAIWEQGSDEYFFETIMPAGHTKHSYNKLPNRLAGNQLRDWGVISSQKEIDEWNSQTYPIHAPQQIKDRARDCDFYKFRGWGLCQITWMSNWCKTIFPILLELYPEKDLKNISYNDLYHLLNYNKDIAIKAYYNFWSNTGTGEYAVKQMQFGNYRPYGTYISGGWEYYISGVYIPRCSLMLEALREQKPYIIDGLNLTPSQIKHIQAKILENANGEVFEKMQLYGGIDGHWGDVSQWAYELVGIDIKDLLL